MLTSSPEGFSLAFPIRPTSKASEKLPGDEDEILLHPIRSATHIWVVTCHKYGISAVVPQMSFRGESYCVGLYLANHTANNFVKKHREKLFSVYTH